MSKYSFSGLLVFIPNAEKSSGLCDLQFCSCINFRYFLTTYSYVCRFATLPGITTT